MEQVKRMRAWVLSAEHILDGSWASRKEEVTNQQVGQRFDVWYQELQALARTGTLSQDEQQYLDHFLKVLTNLRPGLMRCYDIAGFPRTNNDMEGYICAIKTRYRRISGRKNWNAYLLRYGSRVAYYEWWAREGEGKKKLDSKLRLVDRDRWRQLRRDTCRCRSRAAQAPSLSPPTSRLSRRPRDALGASRSDVTIAPTVFKQSGSPLP